MLFYGILFLFLKKYYFLFITLSAASTIAWLFNLYFSINWSGVPYSPKLSFTATNSCGAGLFKASTLEMLSYFSIQILNHNLEEVNKKRILLKSKIPLKRVVLYYFILVNFNAVDICISKKERRYHHPDHSNYFQKHH